MTNYNRQQQVLHSHFDYQTHKEAFTDYAELVITPDGVPHYAIPSHTEFLIQLTCKKLKMSRQELMDYTEEHGLIFDYLDWMIEQTSTILVWNNAFTGQPNPAQKQTLLRLNEEGITRFPAANFLKNLP